jgi:hypothetical protein
LHLVPSDAAASAGSPGCLGVTRFGSLFVLDLEGAVHRRYDAPGHIACTRVHAESSGMVALAGLATGELTAIAVSS